MIYPATIEQKLGFDKIRQWTQEKCATVRAKELLEQPLFSHDFATVDNHLALADEMRIITIFEPSFPDSGFVDILHFISKVGVLGAYLVEEELVLLQQSLGTTNALVAFFARTESAGTQDARHYPNLAALASPIQQLKAVSDRIDHILNRFGQVKDTASPELQQIRRSMHDTQQQIARRMQQLLKAAQAAGYVDEDVQVSIRDGRSVIPVNAASKRKVAGIVLDESTTGKTAFIEPAEVVELNNQLKELGFAERREIVRILTLLTDFIRPYLPDIMASAEFLSTIDVIRAKAIVAAHMGGVKPVLLNEQIIDWHKARHPLLEKALQREGKSVIPLELRLSDNKHILLISGPNAGGKSVCLKTVGLLQYMLQCGFLIPVSESSEAGIFHHIFIDIGDEQSLENDLSTYSSHLQNMKHFLRYADNKTLVLIDEFGTGTEPQLGGAIAEAVLDSLVQRRTFGVITTHYANLKYYATTAPGVQNGAMLFDLQKIEPLFKLEIGSPGSSFAFEIAHKIGLPQDVLTKAKESLGEKHVNFDKSLRDIARDRKYWEEKRMRIKHADKSLEDTLAKYQEELSQLQQDRKRIINEAKEQAKRLLANTNKEIENTIRGIKEAQAEKEKTKELRVKLQTFSEAQTTPNNPTTDHIERKIAKLKEQEQRRDEKRGQHPGTEPNSTAHTAPEASPAAPQYQPGDKVRISGQHTVGEIVRLHDNATAVVAMGSLLTNVKLARLEPISNNEAKKIKLEERKQSSGNEGTSRSVQRLNFKPHVDVRGMRAEEALDEVRNLMDQALMYGTSEVKILHGKGTGILKEEIRRYLKAMYQVESIADELLEQGGAGITVVRL